MIITADIGGTKVDVAAFPTGHKGAGVPAPVHLKKYFTKDFENFTCLLQAFLKELEGKPTAIAVGIAGPVWSDQVKLTNLNWMLDRQQIQETFDCNRVAFLNDMEAHAYGALVAGDDDTILLNQGVKRVGNRALIAAGTGLGEAFMIWNGTHHIPIPCEGGHTSFAPQSELESDLLKFAQKRHHHVSAERLISGSLGFPILRDFFAASGRLQMMQAEHRKLLLETEEVGPVISQLAEQGEETCITMMRTFVAMYGAEASNLVLKVNGIGGLYIGGGIATKIFPWIQEGTFLEAFGNKGRFRGLMESTPIWVIRDKLNALRGLASYAVRMM